MKISIIVPTISGRTSYLEKCLRTCTSQDNDSLEIIVSDNSPGDAADLVYSLNDCRIKYIRPAQYLPMSMHWDFCMANASGDIVSIIGDDDGLMPNCIGEVQAIVREVGPHPIHHSMANYFWPDFPEQEKQNSIHIFHQPHDRLDVISCRDQLNKLCSAQAQYIDGPMLYHCFIPKNLVEQIKSQGRYFHRSAPDVYSAAAILTNCSTFISSGKYLTIFGQAAKANGASVRLNGPDGKRFEQETQTNYAPRFKSKTIQAILLDALLEVSNRFDMPEIAAAIDYPSHLTKAVAELARFQGLHRKSVEFAEILAIAGNKGVLTAFLMKLGRRTSQKLGNKLGQSNTRTSAEHLPPHFFASGNTKDIEGAALYLTDLLRMRDNKHFTK